MEKNNSFKEDTNKYDIELNGQEINEIAINYDPDEMYMSIPIDDTVEIIIDKFTKRKESDLNNQEDLDIYNYEEEELNRFALDKDDYKLYKIK